MSTLFCGDHSVLNPQQQAHGINTRNLILFPKVHKIGSTAV